jgi:hypothetical protein
MYWKRSGCQWIARAVAFSLTLVYAIVAAGCSGGGGGGVLPRVAQAPRPTAQPTTSPTSQPTSAPTTAPGLYEDEMVTSANWLDGRQLSDGAILYSTSEIEPYYANIGATGLTKISSQLAHVRAWMQWFVAHINSSDVWGLGGTIYDYTYNGTTETPTDTADSVDSYNATFLTLARELYDAGDQTSRTYVDSIKPSLEQLANTILALQQPDGLTIALPGWQIAYLMDNSEVYRGLIDIAYLESNAFHDASQAAVYANAAARVATGIQTLWSPASSTFAYAKGETGGTLDPGLWTVWYPDATAQIFPILQGVISPSSAQAESLWGAFNQAYTQWDTLDTPDGFPWALVADTAVLMDDTPSAEVYIQNAQTKYAALGFPWPWYCAEDGWYLRAMNQIDIGISVAVADN